MLKVEISTSWWLETFLTLKSVDRTFKFGKKKVNYRWNACRYIKRGNSREIFVNQLSDEKIL